MPYLILPASQYASEWSQDREIRDTDAVTAVAVQYVKETDPAKKEELLLELIRYFHSYVFKYVSMIASGTLPKVGGAINKDVKLFLRLFLPKESPATGANLAKTARTLNLAFKDMPVEEISCRLSDQGPAEVRSRVHEQSWLVCS